ncbi:MAG: hypothetical protein J6C82_03980 [Clostridia bacterium]|nr:hypothetical protein [Clostridia bacterium]
MTVKKSDNKSLIMYTALIFLVAIVMILISFLGQRHLEEMRVSEMDAENVSLSNKAAQVSEENMQLVELNKTLREKNQTLTDEKDALTLERDTLLKQTSGYEALIAVYSELCDGDEDAAKELLQGIYTEDLSPKQKEIYDILVKKTQ